MNKITSKRAPFVGEPGLVIVIVIVILFLILPRKEVMGVTREQIQDNTGWKVAYATRVAETPPPTKRELEVLRDLQARTKRAQEAA